MDPMEKILLHLRELQPEVPSWAKAEQMEMLDKKSVYVYDKYTTGITYFPNFRFVFNQVSD